MFNFKIFNKIMEKVYRFYTLSASDSPHDIRYVGVTTKTVKQRFYHHKYCAMHDEKRGLPVHKWMYSKYNQGLDIIFNEIDSCNESLWEQKEQELIKQYSEKFDLLNLDKGGNGVITLEKRTKSSIQRSIEGHYKKIVLFNKNEELIAICESCKEAVEKYGCNKTAIGNVLKRRANTCNGYYIVTFEEYNSPDFSIKEHIQSLTDRTIKHKLLYQYDLEGNLIKLWNSQSEVKKELGYDVGGINRAIKNKKIFKNSYWTNTNTIDISEFEKYYKYEYAGLKFRTQKEIADMVGFKECTITNAIKNNRPIKGFIVNRL